jgi:hypothetical protein
MREGRGFGSHLVGFMDAMGVPRKAVCKATGIHPSSFSRKVTGSEAFNEAEILRIGVAIGKLTR